MRSSINRLLVGRCVLLALIAPFQSGANMSRMFMIKGGMNFFGLSKPNFKGLRKPNYAEDKKEQIDKFVEVGAFSTAPANLLNSLDLEVGFYTFYQLNDLFSFGAGVAGGFSGSKEVAKEWSSLSISESFILKVGVAAKITDWVMLSAGLRASQLGFEVNWTDAEKKAKKPGEKYADFRYDHRSSLNGSATVLGWYGDANVLFPISDNIRLIASVGLFGHAEPEFKNRAECTVDVKRKPRIKPVMEFDTHGDDGSVTAHNKMYYIQGKEVLWVHEVRSGGQLIRYLSGNTTNKEGIDQHLKEYTEKVWETKEVSSKLSGRLGIRVSVGIGFEF